MNQRIAIISVHGCPIARLGEKDTGGMNVYVQQLARRLDEAGLEVDIFTRRHDPADPQVVQIGANGRLIHIDAGPPDEEKNGIHHHLPRFIHALEEFRQVRDLRYDVIHTHYWLSGCVGNTLASLWCVPHVVSFHTLAEVKRRARVGEWEPTVRIESERRVVASADHIIAFSQHEKEALVRFYGASQNNVTIIPCGVDTEMFRPLGKTVARHRLGLRSEVRLILYVGRIEPLKGLDMLLQGIRRLDQRRDVQLLIVGGNKNRDLQRELLVERVHQMDMDHSVRFLGPVVQDMLPYYYSAADVCVVPSYYESFSLVALEAMACGTPVVAARVGGLQSVVQDGRTGYLIPRHCPESFEDRLDVLLANESLRRAMGHAGWAWATDMDWTNVAQRIEALYRVVIEQRRPSKLVDQVVVAGGEIV